MKAAVVDVLGQPPKYQDFPDPVRSGNEVIIKVHAAGLHPIVKAVASGAHYSERSQVPMVAGIDGVGTRTDGSRVYFGGARRPWGTMAERSRLLRRCACLCRKGSTMCRQRPSRTLGCRRGFR